MQSNFKGKTTFTKIFSYISLQLFSQWSLFSLLTGEYETKYFDRLGLIVLLSTFFLYAYKTIRLLKIINTDISIEEEKEKALYQDKKLPL